MTKNPSMKLTATTKLLSGGVITARMTALFLAVAALGSARLASGQTPPQIGLKFCVTNAANLQTNVSTVLLPTALAGAFPQTNWNMLGLSGDSSSTVNGQPPFNVLDSSGNNTGITVNWIGNDVWSINGDGGNPTTTGSPDGDLMNAFLDSNGAADITLTNGETVIGGPANNFPLVYFSGLNAWMTAQGINYYDVVLYSCGDTTGRVGEYWLQYASGPTSGLTYGTNLTTPVYICEQSKFTTTLTYVPVPLTVNSGRLSEQNNFQGNYAVFPSLTNDSFILRTEEYNTRCPVNAIQIVPRAALLPAVINPLPASQVYAGGTAAFRPAVAGVIPMSFQWQTNGVNLTDGGNVSGSLSNTLVITDVGPSNAASYTLVVSNSLGMITSSVGSLTIISPVSGSYAERIFTNHPVAYWRLNDTNNPATSNSFALDYAGGFNGIYGQNAKNAFNGVVGPQPPTFPGFEANNAAFQCSSSLANSWEYAPPLNLNTNTVTIIAWIYPTAADQVSSAGIVWERNGGDVSGLDYQNGANQLGYTWNNLSTSYGASWSPSPLIVPTNQWSFVAVVVTPTNATLYCYNTNGQLSATAAATTAGGTNAVAGFTGPTLIGDDPASTSTPQGRGFTGSIDEAAVFNYAVPASEIYNLFKKGLGLNAIPPSISTEPVSLALFESRNAQFSVVASGDTPLLYKWQTNGVFVGNGPGFSGANSATLTVSNVSFLSPINYSVVVANLAVPPATSSVATLTVVATNANLTAYEAALQAANPLHYWRFNETNGSPYAYDYWGGDIATNDNPTTGQNGPQPPTFAGFETTNDAYSFDGLTSGVETELPGALNNLAQFSIIGWFNEGAVEGTRTGLFGQAQNIQFGFAGTIDTSGVWPLIIYTPNGGQATLPQELITPGQWYFTAGVGNGTNISLYLFSANGTGGYTVSQSTAFAPTTNYGSTAFSFNIGGDGVLDATGNYFYGLIDEVAIFNTALSVGQLSGLFAAAIGVNALPPQITAPPIPETVYAGRSASFSVSVVGSTPFTYQWRTNGVPLTDVGNLSGSATATVTVTNVTVANAGNYDVVITNSAGSVTSSVVALGVVTPSPAGYEVTVLDLNPVAYYRLNETNGTTAYDYWGGHPGTYGSQAVFGLSVPGPTNPPFLGFETNNTAVQMADNGTACSVTNNFGTLITNAATFTMWLYPTATEDLYCGLEVNRSGSNPGGFGYTAGHLGYTWNNNNGATYGATWSQNLVPPLNQWSFVALVVTPTNETIYMSDPVTPGLLDIATASVANNVEAKSGIWQIGNDTDGTTRTFAGTIDEVAIFNYSLTEAQIQLLDTTATSGFQPVRLSVQRSGASVILSWPLGTLLEAPTPNGPWTPITTATSPYTVAPSAKAQFFQTEFPYQ